MNQWTYACNGASVVLTTNVGCLYSQVAVEYLWNQWHECAVLRAFREMGKGG